MPDPGSGTRSRILDGALVALTRHGLGRLTLEDVARTAGLSRQTVYRYFGSRDALVTAAILREEQGLIEVITAAAAEHADMRPALEAAIAAGLEAARAHPLLDRLLATEPEALLPFLTTGGGPVLSAARPVIEELFATRMPHLSPAAIRRVGDTTTRLFISYAINPPDDHIAEVAAGLAELILDGLKQSPPERRRSGATPKGPDS
jgi:AcrR family transcriptional regulator